MDITKFGAFAGEMIYGKLKELRNKGNHYFEEIPPIFAQEKASYDNTYMGVHVVIKDVPAAALKAWGELEPFDTDPCIVWINGSPLSLYEPKVIGEYFNERVITGLAKKVKQNEILMSAIKALYPNMDMSFDIYNEKLIVDVDGKRIVADTLETFRDNVC